MRRLAVVVLLIAAAGAAWLLWPHPTAAPAPAPAPGAARLPRPPAERPLVDHIPATLAEDVDDPPGDLILEGQVVDGDDLPVAGALVAIDTVPVRDARTEDDGSFSFAGLVGRTYRLEARAGAAMAGPVRAHLTAASEPVVLVLREAARLEVRVTDAERTTPIAGALVELRALASLIATTDEDGRAHIGSLAGGWHIVKVSAPGHASALREIASSGEPGAVTRLEVALRPGVSLAGVVVDAAGRPVEGARVVAEPASSQLPLEPSRDGVLSDAKGRWRLDGQPLASLRLHAQHPLFAPASTPPLPVTGDRDDLRITLQAGARVSGRVVDADGTPVAGAQVMAGAGNLQAGLVRRVVCDDRGGFELSGLPRQIVYLAARGEAAASALARLDLRDRTAVTDLTLSLDGVASITGLVTTHAGAPVPEARIEAVPVRDDNLGRAEQRLRGPASAIADAAGEFRLVALRPGDYRVRAIRPGAPSELLAMRQGQQVHTGDRVTIEVDDLTAVEGKVAFADGRPAAAFTVAVGNAPAVPFTGGAFRVDGVPAGHQFLAVDGLDFVAIQREVEAVAGEVLDVGTLEVSPGRTVSGKVVDGGGAPVGGATVIVASDLDGDGSTLLPFQESGTHVHQAVTDAQGTYLIGGVRVGSTMIVAEHEAAGRSAPRSLPEGPGDLHVDLVLIAPAVVEGVIRIDGVPGEAGVALLSHGAPNLKQWVASGPDGTYRFDRVSAGTHTLYAQLPRGARLGGGSAPAPTPCTPSCPAAPAWAAAPATAAPSRSRRGRRPTPTSS